MKTVFQTILEIGTLLINDFTANFWMNENSGTLK